MRRLALATLFLLVCPIAVAQMLCHAATPGPGGISPCANKLAAAVPQTEFQKVYWPALMGKLTEENNPGLPFFRQALTQYYGLNYEEAMRNFKEAKKDPTLAAMAAWGIALAAGPNINLTMTDACEKLACDEIECADSLAGGKRKKGCEPTGSIITPLEKKLIDALKKRYVCPASKLSGADAKDAVDKAAKDYSHAMGDIWNGNQNDKNISTLYAESTMDLHPWDQYDQAGLPKRQETVTIVNVLKRSTGNSLEAIGANHYYIHAVEAANPDPKIGSIHPVDALPSANLLQIQVPDSGHLVHMSSHIYLLIGEYQKALEVNIKGVNNDVRQYSDACRGTYTMYTTNDQCPQLYYGHYVSHNYFFGSVSATFLGQSKNAIALACDTQAHVQRFMAYEPALQRYLSAPLMTMVVNRNYDAICAQTDCKGPNPEDPGFKKPDFDDCYRQGQEASGCYILRAIWYWARGMARSSYGTKDDRDRTAMTADLTAMSKETDMIDPCSEATRTARNTFGNNCAKDVLKIGMWMLYSRSQWADRNPEKVIHGLGETVGAEDALVYDEPPQWFTPTREAFGGFYLQVARDIEDIDIRNRYYRKALSQFDAALARHPASGRALYGRMRALEGLGSQDAQAAADKFREAWLTADYTMTDADLWPDKVVSAPSSEVAQPSKCFGHLPAWSKRTEGGRELLLPPADAKDLAAGEVHGSDVRVDYTLLECPKKAAVTGTPPVP